MLHTLTHAGVDEALLAKAAIKRGRPLPEVPELSQGLGLFYRAFMELCSCRQIGMGEGPIPWTAIHTWCDENQVQGDQRARVHYHVRQMDLAYLKHQAGKIKGK